ncbi:MAG: translation initiation factor IF-3, partial [Chrysiogenales bacterium]
MIDKGRRSSGVEKFDRYNVNEEIKATSVRLIQDGAEPIVIATDEALKMARAAELDLVEISPNQDPPVAKIIDYSKFKFEQLKKAKEAKKKQKVIHIKEVKMRPNIDSHDFDHKVKRAKE